MAAPLPNAYAVDHGDYTEVLDTGFLVPAATKPTLVRLALVYRYWTLPVTREVWDTHPDWIKGFTVAEAIDRLRPFMLMDEGWTVGAVREEGIEDRGSSHPSLSIGWVVGTPKVPGVVGADITRAWDAGYRQLLVLSRSALPEGWGQ